MSPTELYTQNIKTIKGKAREYQRRAPHISLEEFESECNETFVRCMNSYDPKKSASFTTYLNRALRNSLELFLVYFVLDWEELQEYIKEERKETDVDFPLWISNLSRKSQDVISVIFNTDPDKITNKFRDDKISKNTLTKYLRKLNWKYTDIYHCFDEIKLALERV